MADHAHAGRLLLAGVLACLVGCSTVPPPGTPPARSGTPTSATSPPPATGTPPETATGTPPAPATAPDVELHVLSGDWAQTSGPVVATDGDEVVWPSIASYSDATGPLVPDLVSFRPASGEDPHLLYRGPDRDSLIWDVAVRNGRYAFLEMNTRLLGEEGWRLWALADPNGPAVLLDERDGPQDGRPAAAFTLTDDSVIWTVVHDRQGVRTFELREASFDGSHNRARLSTPIAKRQFFYPTVDPTASTLAYATVEHTKDGDRFRLWTLDLTRADAEPVAVPGVEDGTQPVINGTTMAWRTIDDNVANWGKELVVAAADGHDAQLTPQQQLTSLTRLSIGRRFIAFETIVGSDLALYDTDSHGLITIEHHALPDTITLQRGWTVLAGDLLVFRRVDGADSDHPAPPQIVWARLPGPGT